MKTKITIELLCSLIIICWIRNGHAESALDGFSTPAWNMTTPNFNITDIPDAVVESALNIDRGKYEPITFDFQNDQGLELEFIRYSSQEERANEIRIYVHYYRCINRFQKCIMSATVQTPVCAYNNPWPKPESLYYSGYMSTLNYCEVFFDNCRRGYRAWRIIDYGVCDFVHQSNWDNVQHTRRARSLLVEKLLKSLLKENSITNQRNVPKLFTESS